MDRIIIMYTCNALLAFFLLDNYNLKKNLFYIYKYNKNKKKFINIELIIYRIYMFRDIII